MRKVPLIRCCCCVLAILFSGGCLSQRHYASLYQRKAEAPIGLDAAGDFRRVSVAAHEAHRRVNVLSRDEFVEHTRCIWLRQRLFAAAVAARRHVGWVWAFPLSWPLHVVTLWSWPGVELATASRVRAAAARVERAYQTSDEAFLAACRREMGTKLGRVMVAYPIMNDKL
ncbi:MAG: hypothetical protein AAF471_06635 [Myxococcota bacterium]